MSNVFSSVPFLESLGTARFPRGRWSIETVGLGEHRFRVLVVGRQPVTSVPWLDFLEPLGPGDGPRTADRRVGYVPRAALASIPAAEWPAAAARTPAPLPSPYIDWRQFPTLADFDARPWAQGRNGAERGRRWRRVVKAFGEARYTTHTSDPTVFDACIAWKRSQYRATGVGDALADERSVRLFRELLERGVLEVSALHGGDTLLAAHVGLLWEGRRYWWLPAYDPAHTKLSAGRVLLEAMLEEGHARGDREFDFLLGDEAYKWSYASHTRLVTPLGTTPLALRANRLVRQGLKRALQLSPGLWRVVQRTRGRRPA